MDLLPSYCRHVWVRCCTPKWLSISTYLSLFFLPSPPPPQFPKNNSRMPSVNIIEVWLPGPLHSLYFKILRSNEQAGPAFKPICLSEWSRGSGPLTGALAPPALGHGTEMGPQDSGRRGPVTAQPVWACSLQRGGCGKSPVTWSVVAASRSGGLVLQHARREDRATPGTEHGEQSQRDFSVFFLLLVTCSLNSRSLTTFPVPCFQRRRKVRLVQAYISLSLYSSFLCTLDCSQYFNCVTVVVDFFGLLNMTPKGRPCLFSCRPMFPYFHFF